MRTRITGKETETVIDWKKLKELVPSYKSGDLTIEQIYKQYPQVVSEQIIDWSLTV
jgi:hypothetical protein